MAEDSPTPEIERDGSAPVQQADAGEADKVDLVGLIADEFGVARSVARMDIALGKIEIDGEPYSYSDDGMWLDRAKVEGKTVSVKGGHTNRTYVFQVA